MNVFRDLVIHLDTNGDYIPDKMIIKQADIKARKLKVKITDGGKQTDVADLKLTLSWKSLVDQKRMGLQPFDAAVDPQGYFTCEIPTEACAVKGDVLCAIQIKQKTSDEWLLETDNFIMYCGGSPVAPTAVYQDTNFKAYLELAANTESITTNASEIIEAKKREFDSARTQKEQEFTDSLNKKEQAFDTALASKEQAYTTAEADRERRYGLAEAERDRKYSVAEEARNGKNETKIQEAVQAANLKLEENNRKQAELVQQLTTKKEEWATSLTQHEQSWDTQQRSRDTTAQQKIEELEAKIRAFDGAIPLTKEVADTHYQPKGEYATTQELQAEFKKLIGTAPQELDTLGEIATKIKESGDTVSGLVSSMAAKADKTQLADYTPTSELTANYVTNTKLSQELTRYQPTGSYALTSQLETKANATELAKYMQKTEMGTYAQKSELGSYQKIVKTFNHEPTTSDLPNNELGVDTTKGMLYFNNVGRIMPVGGGGGISGVSDPDGDIAALKAGTDTAKLNAIFARSKNVGKLFGLAIGSSETLFDPKQTLADILDDETTFKMLMNNEMLSRALFNSDMAVSILSQHVTFMDKVLNSDIFTDRILSSTVGVDFLKVHGEVVVKFFENKNSFNNMTASKNLASFNAILASLTAMTAVAASLTAMTAVAASSTAMNAVAASSTAMNAVADSEQLPGILKKMLIDKNNEVQKAFLTSEYATPQYFNKLYQKIKVSKLFRKTETKWAYEPVKKENCLVFMNYYDPNYNINLRTSNGEIVKTYKQTGTQESSNTFSHAIGMSFEYFNGEYTTHESYKIV